MRTALIPYVNQYVLAKGWITDWKDDEETQTRRMYVSNVIVKKQISTKPLISKHLYQRKTTLTSSSHSDTFQRTFMIDTLALPLLGILQNTPERTEVLITD